MSLTRTVPSYLPFDVEVVAVRQLSPSFVRITFAGQDLVNVHDGGSLGTRDTRVKIVIPASSARPFADIDISDPNWYRTLLALDPAIRGHLRTYTARSVRAAATVPEMDIDFVLHLDEQGSGGPATVWAANALPGQRLTVIAPNRSYGEVTGLEWKPPTPAPGQRLRVLLAGDETAAPAIAAILETLPDEHVGDALIEVPTAADHPKIEAPPGITVTFLNRDGEPRGQRLRAAVASVLPGHRPAGYRAPDVPAVDVDSHLMWETPQPGGRTGAESPAPFYAWVAGEAAVVRDLRQTLLRTHGIPREAVAFMGYWRQGRAEG